MDIEQFMRDVLADANYTSGYWCHSCVPTIYDKALGEENSYPITGILEDSWFDCLKDGGWLEILDDDGEYHKITLDSLKQATENHLSRKYKTLNPTEEQLAGWDGYDADAVFQIASMGDVVYG